MHASLRIENARVWTADPARPWASEIRIADGMVVDLDGVRSAPSMVDQVIDAAGRVIVPGLIDSHLHLLAGGRSLTEVDLSRVRSRREFEQAIADAHAQLPPDRWLIGRGWCEENWPGHEPPTARWLAPAGAMRPCVCYRMDIHAAVVNDAVLRMINAADRDDPPGGRIVRDGQSGAPTGLLQEAAAWTLVNPLIPAMDPQAKRECLLTAQRHAHAFGLTAVGSMEYLHDAREIFAPLADELMLRCHLTLLDRDWPLNVDAGLNFENTDRLKVIGFKTFIDGTLGSRTARMLADYSDDPGNRGLLLELTAGGHLREWIRLVADHGLSPSMHAIGDEAARLALDAIGTLPPDVRRAVRPRIEHAQQLDVADIARFRNVIASMQPLHKADDARYVERRLGRDRTRGTFAFRSLLDAGALLAFGSDWPVVSCDPVLGMRAAITGLTLDEKPFGVEQNLTVEETLLAYTRDAACCLHMDADDRGGGAGMLREGYAGDCVMFDNDPFTADWARRPPAVSMTIVGGKVVFDAEAEEVKEKSKSAPARRAVPSRGWQPADALSHLDAHGAARMVDVGDKPPMKREAIAEGFLIAAPATLDRVFKRGGADLPKGEALSVARIAGIAAAKKCDELIPLCHTLPLDAVNIAFDRAARNKVRITATARITAKTGVEMEALTAVAIAALTLYDMTKAIDKTMRIDGVRLVSKTKSPA